MHQRLMSTHTCTQRHADKQRHTHSLIQTHAYSHTHTLSHTHTHMHTKTCRYTKPHTFTHTNACTDKELQVDSVRRPLRGALPCFPSFIKTWRYVPHMPSSVLSTNPLCPIDRPSISACHFPIGKLANIAFDLHLGTSICFACVYMLINILMCKPWL